MPKLPPKPKLDYSIRRRFFNEIGQPQEWQDYGHGTYDLETVQRQIKMLSERPRKVEIEVVYNGKLIGYNGKETGKTIILEKR